jgi:hypothetical protein
MSKSGYNEVNLGRIFNHLTGHRTDPSEQLAMDFRGAVNIVRGANGPELQATFIDPQTGRAINLGAKDVERLQEWTHAATVEARNDAIIAQRAFNQADKDYRDLYRVAAADGNFTAQERQMLRDQYADRAAARQEWVSEHREYQGYARQNNEIIDAQKQMIEVGDEHNRRIAANPAPGGIAP